MAHHVPSGPGWAWSVVGPLNHEKPTTQKLKVPRVISPDEGKSLEKTKTMGVVVFGSFGLLLMFKEPKKIP